MCAGSFRKSATGKRPSRPRSRSRQPSPSVSQRLADSARVTELIASDVSAVPRRRGDLDKRRARPGAWPTTCRKPPSTCTRASRPSGCEATVPAAAASRWARSLSPPPCWRWHSGVLSAAGGRARSSSRREHSEAEVALGRRLFFDPCSRQTAACRVRRAIGPIAASATGAPVDRRLGCAAQAAYAPPVQSGLGPHVLLGWTRDFARTSGARAIRNADEMGFPATRRRRNCAPFRRMSTSSPPSLPAPPSR